MTMVIPQKQLAEISTEVSRRGVHSDEIEERNAG